MGLAWEQAGLTRNWAKPPAGVTEKLATIAGGKPKPIKYQVKVAPGASVTVAVALCEGWHDQAGQRVLDLAVEGAPVKTVDTVADLGKNVAGAFWFDAKDANNDGLIDLASPRPRRRRTRIRSSTASGSSTRTSSTTTTALLAGSLDEQAASVNYAGQPDLQSRKDFILVHVTNKGNIPQTISPKVIVQSRLPMESLNDSQIRVDAHETVLCTEKVASIKKQKADRGEEAVMTLEPITIEPGETVSFAVVYCGGGRIDATPLTTEDVVKERQATVDFWKTVASALRSRRRARQEDPGAVRQFDSQHLAGPRDQARAAGVPGRPDRLSRIVDRRRRVHSRSGHDARRRRSNPGGHRLRVHLPASRRPLRNPAAFLQGKRHRALDLDAARPADARQGVAAVGLAEGRKDGRLHQGTPQGELQGRLAVERRPDAARRGRRRHRRRASLRIHERLLEPDRLEGRHRRRPLARQRRAGRRVAEGIRRFLRHLPQVRAARSRATTSTATAIWAF